MYLRNHDGNKVASDVELDEKEKLFEFLQLFYFPDLVGVPLLQTRHFSAILKTIPLNY